MKVLTIGRSSNNNVVLTDSKASRVHCQIIQFDNGTFAIVDFNSTNGTFVNGVRINGQVALKPGDRVQVASTDIAWQQYFPATRKKCGSSPWVWTSVAAGAVATVALVVFLILHFSVGKPVDKMFAGNYPPAAMVMYEEDGVAYSVEAVQGQVVVMFKENVSHRDAVRAIRKAGGKVVAQMPNLHYYLVDAGAGNENAFMQDIESCAITEFVYPNALSCICEVTPYVMDDFREKDENRATHGDMVSYTIKECGTGISAIHYNENVDGKRIKWSEVAKDLNEILSEADADNPPVINMSFGIPLKVAGEDMYWKTAPDSSRNNYRKAYISEIKAMLSIIKKYDDKEFIIVKATGNDGVKSFGDDIIEPLYSELSGRQRSIMDRHVILVAAEDTRWSLYSNEMESGVYHPWVTKVDISDLKYKGEDIHGTSFSSPRASCLIISASKRHSINPTKVLEYAREATRIHPAHMLTEEMLDGLIEADRDKGDRPAVTENPKQPSPPASMPDFLIGTKWRCEGPKSGTSAVNIRYIEFTSSSKAIITDYNHVFGMVKSELKKWYYNPRTERVIICYGDDYNVSYKYDGRYLIELNVGVEWDKYSRIR